MLHLCRSVSMMLALSLAAGPVAADTLFLRDGGKLNGTVANHERYRPHVAMPDSITLALDSTTVMRVPCADVAELLLEDGGHVRLLELPASTTPGKPVTPWGGLVAPAHKGPTSLRTSGTALLVGGAAMLALGAGVKFGHARLEFLGSTIDLGDYYNEWNYVLMGAGGAGMLGGIIMLSAAPGPRDATTHLQAAVTKKF